MGPRFRVGSRTSFRACASRAAVLIAAPAAGTAWAQAKEMFVPSLVYRTGPYAPSGTPFANGMWDYLTMLNERDGGVNGVKLIVERQMQGVQRNHDQIKMLRDQFRAA